MSVNIQLFEHPWDPNNLPQWLNVLARWGTIPEELWQPRYPVASFTDLALLAADQLIVLEDLPTEQRITDATREYFVNQVGARSTIFVPLVVSGQWIGYVNALYPQRTVFPEAEQRRLMNLSRQAAVAIQNRYQLQETVARARRERMIREIVGQIQAAPDVEGVLATAARELGRAMRTTRSFVQLGKPGAETGKKPGTGSLAETMPADE